jgi:hypothetical protein
MTVGSPATDTLNGTKKGLAYTCLETILTRGYETPDFPQKPCAAGIMGIYPPLLLLSLPSSSLPFHQPKIPRIQLTDSIFCLTIAIHHFPSCWDGANLDSPDHQSHMFSTTKGGFRPAGPCPASHPVKMPQLAYETMWDTTAFADMWPTDGTQPFVWSYSDSKVSGPFSPSSSLTDSVPSHL